MKRRGKIARLSWERQHELNCNLETAVSGKEVLAWLNSLPEMQAIVRDFFAGKPVSKQNLSEWTKGGYQEWRVRLGKVAGALNLARDAADLEFATQGRLADRLATAVTGRYASLLQGWDGEVTGEFTKKLRVLQRIVQDSANLRRWDHDAIRVRLAESAHAAGEEQTNEALFEQFEQWARKPKVRDYLLMQQQTQREQEQRECARWELLKPPVNVPPEAPPPAAPVPGPSSAPPPQNQDARPQTPPPQSNPVQVSPGQSNLSAGAGTACLPIKDTQPQPPEPPEKSPHPPVCKDRCEESGFNFCRKCGLTPADIHNWPLRSEEMRRDILFHARARRQGRL